jgi:DNA-binding PadR family transcriptional regulator
MLRSKGKKRGGLGGRASGLTTADLIVLSLLAERPMHGYDLVREYERQEVADWASVSKAQVYYALQKLAGLNLIAPLAQAGVADARDKMVYQPTDGGLSGLKQALIQRDWGATRIAQPFATWLGLSIHLSDAQIDQQLQARATFLSAELARERASLDYIRTLATPRARAGENIVALVISQLEAEREWLNALMARR